MRLFADFSAKWQHRRANSVTGVRYDSKTAQIDRITAAVSVSRGTSPGTNRCRADPSYSTPGKPGNGAC
ncbi:hypothetical protein [Bacillus sp. 3255]|uniref:hypothetical protein n=1 Tax=Bacillus sp. 3255 TaxID=2817904 RepID=UPI00286C2E72|nr:hypothetical protein [Bacillus sp. 3255]